MFKTDNDMVNPGCLVRKVKPLVRVFAF